MNELAHLTVDSDTDVIVVTITGEVDLSNAAEITSAIASAAPNEAAGVVVDLSDLSYLDSSGIRMLAELARRLDWRQQTLRVVAPQGSRARKVLTISGTEPVLLLDPSVDAARVHVTGG
jgi:anti-anti-sigma factor